jgi:hypothetical protein
MTNIEYVLGVTGLTLEQLFEYLSEAIRAIVDNRCLPSTPLIDGKASEFIKDDVDQALNMMVNSLFDSMSDVLSKVKSAEVLEVSKKDEMALVELIPNEPTDTVSSTD